VAGPTHFSLHPFHFVQKGKELFTPERRLAMEDVVGFSICTSF
jgi:hypothetical protein